MRTRYSPDRVVPACLNIFYRRLTPGPTGGSPSRLRLARFASWRGAREHGDSDPTDSSYGIRGRRGVVRAGSWIASVLLLAPAITLAERTAQGWSPSKEPGPRAHSGTNRSTNAMDKRSTNYRDRLRSELVAASRWLHREHQGVRAPSGALREPHRRRRFSVGNTLGIALAAGRRGASGRPGERGHSGRGQNGSRWMATPTAPAEGQTAAAERARLAKTGVSRGTPPRSFSRSALAEAQSGPWHVPVADTRGRFTFVLLQSSNQEAIGSCLATSSRAYGTGEFSGFPGGKPPAAPAGQIRIEGGGGSASRGSAPNLRTGDIPTRSSGARKARVSPG